MQAGLQVCQMTKAYHFMIIPELTLVFWPCKNIKGFAVFTRLTAALVIYQIIPMSRMVLGLSHSFARSHLVHYMVNIDDPRSSQHLRMDLADLTMVIHHWVEPIRIDIFQLIMSLLDHRE